MLEALVKFALAYLLGNLMGGQIMGVLRGGIDLRQLGSGNVGATNALRTQGPRFALVVLLIDVLKGVVAALAIPALPWPAGWSGGAAAAGLLPWVGYACGVGVALGHCYPVTLGLRGGKGVATLAGVFGALMPLALPLMLLVFALVVLFTGLVSAATLAAAASALLWALWIAGHDPRSPAVLFTVAMAALVVFKHRYNLLRLLRGEEHRFEKARVLGRRLDRWRARRAAGRA